MARSRHCRVCGDWHDFNTAWPSECRGHFETRGPRSDLPMPMLIRDSMDPTASPLTGELFDSKRGYYKHIAQNGCEIVGDDRAPFDAPKTFEPTNVGQSIKDAMDQIEAGYVPPQETDIAA